MKLLPLRDYSKHNVLQFASLQEGSGDMGCAVQFVGSGIEMSKAVMSPGASLSPQLGNTVYNPRWEVTNKVKLTTGAAAASQVAGILLFHVRDTNELGENTLWNRTKWAEQSIVPSGYAVPMVREGLFYIGDFNNTTGGAGLASAGKAVVTAANGQLAVGAETLTKVGGRIGTFLGPANANGFALIDLDI